jgi:hypothetical protein
MDRGQGFNGGPTSVLVVDQRRRRDDERGTR